MDPPPATLPDVTGRWTGIWSAFNPADATPSAERNRMDAHVEQDGDVWKTTFEAECGRPYAYTVTMKGRRAGHVVLFTGTTDLGPDDGGEYDWIGRATDREFVGFYTSAHYTGVFILARAT